MENGRDPIVYKHYGFKSLKVEAAKDYAYLNPWLAEWLSRHDDLQVAPGPIDGMFGTLVDTGYMAVQGFGTNPPIVGWLRFTTNHGELHVSLCANRK